MDLKSGLILIYKHFNHNAPINKVKGDMKIIIEGREVDTLDIWDIILETNTRNCSVIVKIKDSNPLIISRSIPYETRNGEFQQYWQPYKNLYKELKSKWDADKSEIPVFKL
ncbi:hypothetical protein [Mucilaginibacter sp. 10I4]|uniref:hypothetical protein n=1 Tax=Mucilaginibacter sp. 10I4 TaxID=3048580 RepID=UPI002B22763B|nr:hypothetical protein [Mucilaginibacter sp. 10I4]MEB0262910.1 hypothetical protein [Mucilaginibacter sp. 10I4]